MKNKIKLITILCLIGTIVLLFAFLVLKLIKSTPKNQEDSQIEFVYNSLTSRYLSDKEKSLVSDGKYSSTSLFEDGRELEFLGEFNTESDRLIHLCISDGSKKLDVKNDNITEEYIKENAKFKTSFDKCKFN